ncbi:hypothetical protein BaRGS_00019602 [Batillaria attramentaria]|uniref:Uncharacterized protein n=1 Tax=Batillaria attramentaria TaxID=370345 RepID=A0ABD0KQ03_9CAEN
MNIATQNGMGIKPVPKQKASSGMGLKTQHGMGLKQTNGMGMSSDKNYFKFNEYQRKRQYFFGDRGKGNPNKKKPPPKPAPKPVEKEEKPKEVKQELPPIEPLPKLHGNSLGSMQRMLHMFSREPSPQPFTNGTDAARPADW